MSAVRSHSVAFNEQHHVVSAVGLVVKSSPSRPFQFLKQHLQPSKILLTPKDKFRPHATMSGPLQQGVMVIGHAVISNIPITIHVPHTNIDPAAPTSTPVGPGHPNSNITNPTKLKLDHKTGNVKDSYISNSKQIGNIAANNQSQPANSHFAEYEGKDSDAAIKSRADRVKANGKVLNTLGPSPLQEAIGGKGDAPKVDLGWHDSSERSDGRSGSPDHLTANLNGDAWHVQRDGTAKVIRKVGGEGLPAQNVQVKYPREAQFAQEGKKEADGLRDLMAKGKPNDDEHAFVGAAK